MSRSWKRSERGIARVIGTTRIPITGRTHRQGAPATPDLRHDGAYAIEAKSRATVPLWLLRAIRQAEQVARDAWRFRQLKQVPIAVIHQDRSHYRNSLVVLRLKDALELLPGLRVELVDVAEVEASEG